MKYIIGSRCSGVSTEIVMQSVAYDIPILVTYYSQINIYNEKALSLGLKFPKYVLLKDMRGYKGDILIDNNAMVLKQLMHTEYGFNGKIVAIGDTVE